MDNDLNYQHRVAAAKLAAILAARKRKGKSIDPNVANELEFHRNALKEDIQYIEESYNFFLYFAQKADESGKGAEKVRSHLLNAEKARLRLKKFDVEHNKVRLSKEMWLRKKYNLPV